MKKTFTLWEYLLAIYSYFNTKVMRCIFVLMLVTVFQAYAENSYSQEARLNMDLNDVTVQNVLDEIESQSEFFFLFNRKLVDVNRKIEISIDNQDIDETLAQVFHGVDVDYLVIDRQIVLSTSEHLQGTKSMIQVRTITGTIVDSGGEPLIGVTVSAKGTSLGTITDASGKYSLSDVPEDATLVFSYIGMTTQEMVIGNQTTIDVVLEADAIGLEEVIVTGYGSQRKSDLTGAIYSIKTDKLQDMPNTNILQSLQGTVPGLIVTNSNSVPGASPQIRIRGENSLSASNNPLIVVDGITFLGNLDEISPNDIESASVLKDASASSIYGARAANGVILITTKKGRKGKAQINYRGYIGVQSLAKRLDVMNGDEYFDYRVESAKNQGDATDFSPEAILNSAELPQYYAGTEIDWQDYVLRTGLQHEHNLSISGGSEKTTYYTSLNYFDQEGIMEYTGMKRITVRTNVDHEINDWLKAGVNTQLSNKSLNGFIHKYQGEYPGKLPDFADAMRLSPYGQDKDETGRYAFYPMFPQTFYNYNHPFANDGATADNESKRAIINVYGEIDFPFLEGLSYRMLYGADFTNHEVGYYWPSYTYYGFPFNGVAETHNNNTERWTWENILKYEKDFNDHHIDFTGLFSREGFSQRAYEQGATGFVNDDNLYHYVEAADSKEVFSSLVETNLVSYMARLNYNYKGKYFLTANARRDGYSGFGENNKYGVFPSVALGWVLTNESFMQNSGAVSFLNYLKIRASLGENGNQGISPYQTLDQLRTRNYIYGNNPTTANGLLISTVGNPDLKWESTVTFNLGIDFAILQNRISGNLEYYQSHSNDLLMTRQVPVMNGYRSLWYNIGETENKGVEINLNTVNVQQNKFRWSTNLNFSLNRDKIIKLRGDGVDDLANNWFIGEPLRVYFDYNRLGLWQIGDDIANGPMPTAEPGTPKLEDVVEDNILNAEDRIIIGSQLPSWVGGMTNTLTLGNWSFSVYIYAVQGIIKPDDLGAAYRDVPYWTESRANNEYPAPGKTQAIASGKYRDASYVRIKDASLAYTFPSTALNNIGISNLKLYLSGRNLYTFTDWMAFDPEAASVEGPYPNARTIVFGINLGF